MSVRKRLLISNIIMIVVPALVAGAVGVLCLFAASFVLSNGESTLESDDFYRKGMDIAALVEKAASSDADQREHFLAEAESRVEAEGFAMEILRDDAAWRTSGTFSGDDAELMAAVDAFAAEGEQDAADVTSEGRSVHSQILQADESLWVVHIFGDTAMPVPFARKVVFTVVAAVVLLVSVLAATALASRMLARFATCRITRQLDELSAGVRQIRDGNLDYRLTADGDEEFVPLCVGFNEMAERLAHSVERDRRREESRKALVAGLSHDLRSPLTSIQAYAEGLENGVAATPEARRRYLSVIREKAGDIEHMVAQLTVISKLDMDEYPLNMETLRLDEVAERFLARDGEALRARGLAIECRLAPVTVRADAAECDRVLGNVVENCAKYARTQPDDTVNVFIGLRTSPDGVELSIADDGPGVAADNLEKLFDPLYRGDEARRNPREGNGLGLFVVARAMQRMGGTARACAAEGGGLKIVLVFPRAGEEGDDLA